MPATRGAANPEGAQKSAAAADLASCAVVPGLVVVIDAATGGTECRPKKTGPHVQTKENGTPCACFWAPAGAAGCWTQYLVAECLIALRSWLTERMAGIANTKCAGMPANNTCRNPAVGVSPVTAVRMPSPTPMRH